MAGLSRDNVVAFRLAAQHLAARLPAGGLTRAAERAQLVRRYLHLYGPSTADDFAAWAGISRAFAGRSWSLVAAELDEVTFAGRRCFILSVDADRFAEPPRPRGVRLVPAYDAYLQGRDRAIAVPDTRLHKRIWRSTGNPGVVLRNGEVVGLWRQKKNGRTLAITVQPVAPLTAKDHSAITAEAEPYADLRGCTATSVTFSA